jgi:hypothetical protein
MRPTLVSPSKTRRPQPLACSLTRFRNAAAIAAVLSLAASASQSHAVDWEGTLSGGAFGLPGDGLLWTNPNNWSGDTLPSPFDSVLFGNPGAAAGTILLNGNQEVSDLTFTESYTLGAYGTSNVLTNTSGVVSVSSGELATINASYGGLGGVFLTGGGTLFLNHPAPTFGGNISVDGAGTTLLHRQEGLTPQYNGINGSQEFGRFDPVTLGYTTATRTITLTNGGEYKIIGTGGNPEANHKNIVIGSGGGTLNLAAGYILQNLDDIGQITVTTEAFTLDGKGRLTISGTMANGTGTAPNFTGGNPLGGIVNINGGMLDLSTTANTVVGANTYVRFSGIAATGSTLNINAGGTMMWNNGTQGFIDTRSSMRTTGRSWPLTATTTSSAIPSLVARPP